MVVDASTGGRPLPAPPSTLGPIPRGTSKGAREPGGAGGAAGTPGPIAPPEPLGPIAPPAPVVADEATGAGRPDEATGAAVSAGGGCRTAAAVADAAAGAGAGLPGTAAVHGHQRLGVAAGDPNERSATINPIETKANRTLQSKAKWNHASRLTRVTSSRPTCQASGMPAGRSGTADLPLHGGRVPAWLSARMARLGRVIVEAIAHEYGRTEVLRRLSNPFWFQSFGAVMGMDWHSSGITTSVIGALKRGLAPIEDELGLHVCGGRGRHSRRTPDELMALGERVGLDAPALVRASRLVAKVDSAAVQDGFDLYLHGFIVADDGAWVVVQQGMNGARRQARRYHWLWDRAGAFVEEPHAAHRGASRRRDREPHRPPRGGGAR